MNKSNKPLGENGAYWSERMRIYEKVCAEKNAKFTKEIEAAFRKANADIDRDLERWYTRLAKNNGISLASARRLLTANELEEFKWGVDEYLQKARESKNGKWIKEIENASARVHISRLEAMKLSVRNTLETAFGTENSLVREMAESAYKDGFYHAAMEVQNVVGVNWDIGAIDDDTIKKVINKPWTRDRRTFSDRIWSKKEQMISELQEELTRRCIYGRSLDETISSIEKYVDPKFKNARYAARRLVVTERAYFTTLGHYDELRELGVEAFQVDLPIDQRSCEICREMNGRVFPMSEFQIGLNAPPFHPNCENGGIIPCADEDFEEALREAHAADGKKADKQITLEEWEKEFVKEGLTNKPDGGIIKSIGDLKINTRPHDIASDLRDTNPNYSRGVIYKKNCGNCAVAYELRRRGYDVEARPSNGSVGGEIISMFKDFVAMKPSGDTKESVVRDLIETALSWENNSRGIVSLQWKSVDFRHYILIEVLNNKVMFVDPQLAKQDVSDYFDKIYLDKILFGRIDDLELSETVINAVINKG